MRGGLTGWEDRDDDDVIERNRWQRAALGIGDSQVRLSCNHMLGGARLSTANCMHS